MPHYHYQNKNYPGVTTPSSFTDEQAGLWDNIRKKKEREGKNYKPAKPGDKDRPDPQQWKKLTKASYDYKCPVCGLTLEYERKKANYKCPRDGSVMYLD